MPRKLSSNKFATDLYKVLKPFLNKEGTKSAVVDLLKQQYEELDLCVRRSKSKKSDGPKTTTSYFVFQKEKREEARNSLPEDERANVTRVGKRLGEMWKKLSDADKKVYKDKADKHNSSVVTDKPAAKEAAPAAKKSADKPAAKEKAAPKSEKAPKAKTSAKKK